MKILKFYADNIKKIRVVEIEPKTPVVQIIGKNGQGKSSVLDSIFWALGGKDGIQNVPIRQGEKKARIRLDLGDFIVERKFTPNGTTITVQNREGAIYSSPQAMLDALFGELCFDPLAFSRMYPRQQFDELRRISKLAVDIDALEASNKLDFVKRTDINRLAKAKRSQAEGITLPADLPTEPIDESDLLTQLQNAATHNTTIETRKARREQTKRDAEDQRKEAAHIQKEFDSHARNSTERLAELLRQAEQYKEEALEFAAQLKKKQVAAIKAAESIDETIAKAQPLPEPVNVADLRTSLDQAKYTNQLIAKRESAKEIAAEASTLEAQAQQITDRMGDREKQKQDAIQSAQMPVEGLGFGSGCVTYNGLPFDQASSAEQLRVSLAIAMAANPKLRVIRIRDGGLLDDDGLAIVTQMAQEQDFQIWMESVKSDAPMAIEMEDGSVKEKLVEEMVGA